MLIQFHMLQNYAPANLNRDDTGAPKDAVFGGKRRGRISSQCLKRSIRRSESFKQAFSASRLLGVRTKLLPGLIAEELQALGADAEAVKAIVDRVPEIGRESKKAKETEEDTPETEAAETSSIGETKQLIFIGRDELKPMAEKLLKMYQTIGAAKWGKAKIDVITAGLGPSLPRSVDIAMFGRMTTSGAFEDVDAAVQVAHAISTNALSPEFDYYTAVDDLSNESGAGMIGDVEFNSSTYYKYLNVHWEELAHNLGGDVQVACQAVIALLEAAMTAQPTGKQNTFAAFNLPDLVLVEVSDRNLPVNYANAFLKPVISSGDLSLMDASIQRLSTYIDRLSTAYTIDARRVCLSISDETIHSAAPASTVVELKSWLEKQLPVAG